jgi:hypothetical protein
MGTTVTPNLGLIKPDDGENIAPNLPTYLGWPTHNVTNCDKIDALFRKDSSTYTLNLTGSSSNPTLGATGLLEGKYARVFPRMVFVWFRIYLGSTGFLAGSGTYRINGPSTFDAILAAGDSSRSIPVGKAVFRDASAVATSSAFMVVYDPASNTFNFVQSQGGLFTSAQAGQDDRISGYFMYPTTDA